MKKVLGLDLGTTSIGWAIINQAENDNEQSSIVKAGVRVNPLTTDEKGQFEKGQSVTTNAERTAKRSIRRNLQRYKLRRNLLIETLKREGWIAEDTILSESGKMSTYETLRLRSESVTSEISLAELSRVLLNINKKRGYKSSRKEKVDSTDGHLIDGMEVARILYDKNMLPCQYSLKLIKEGKKILPDYYRSDLEQEYESIWKKQASFYPEYLTEDFHKQLSSQNKSGVSKIFLEKYGIYTADNKGADKKTTALVWRQEALVNQLDISVVAYVLGILRETISNSSGYLGEISDRSKELFFNNLTVGQYLYNHIIAEPGYSTKNKIFYRQDYLDEFERIWECQKKYHPELTGSLKKEIRDIIIFYQRPLKSQKGLVSFCEFESHPIHITIDGKDVVKTRGCKVAPRSSLLFQEFKIWQILNNISITDTSTNETISLSTEQKDDLAKELTSKPKMSANDVLHYFGFKGRRYELNYQSIEGNSTMSAIYDKCLKIVDITGHGCYSVSKIPFDDVHTIVHEVFTALGFKTNFLEFDSSLPKELYEQQASHKLWHLLYSYEGDNSVTGNESLIAKISSICGMPSEYAKIISEVKLVDNYASLSHKAIRKILPHLKGGNTYDIACSYAGYNHSHFKTKEENDCRELKKTLEILPKGALRNPVVEKIINQMINVVNQASEVYGHPDEIHIEFARELKQNQKQRQKTTKDIAAKTRENEQIKSILHKEFGLSYISQSDILRYRLYEELKDNGYKTLYSAKYIPRDLLFSKFIDIEHIIPQARFFNDSFANKTLEFRDINIEKGKQTAREFIQSKYGEEKLADYIANINDLHQRGCISRSKRDFLLMAGTDIPKDFLNRDLSNSQYIAKKAKEILDEYVRTVLTTTGSVTARLREDWQLVDVMKEINLPKYRAHGLTYKEDRGDGRIIEKISDWTKRDDHRHHAMDAITIAFTRTPHIQILNNLNADSDKDPQFYALKRKEIHKNGSFNPPMPLDSLRSEAKKALESIIVSIKAKNKVSTTNVNKIKTKDGQKTQSVQTPRGSLHMEQVYGKRLFYETFIVPVGAKMTAEVIEQVASQAERIALKTRLDEFSGDAKKAFSGMNAINKKPIFLDSSHSSVVPPKVKCVRFKSVYGIRKEIGPKLKIDKVADPKIKAILQKRLDDYDGNASKAFSNLNENPIWLNKEKNICIKRVTIFENFDLVSLRDKKDKDGSTLLDINGQPIANDFVNLRNNHHIAIYRDSEGRLNEIVVPFIEALQRKISGYPIVDRDYKKEEGWSFVFSLKINEIFVFPNESTGFIPEEVDLLNPENYAVISPNLYRVQKLSSGVYYFRHHLETSINEDNNLKDLTWKRVQSVSKLEGVIKVRVNHIGQIVSIGEYD